MGASEIEGDGRVYRMSRADRVAYTLQMLGYILMAAAPLRFAFCFDQSPAIEKISRPIAAALRDWFFTLEHAAIDAPSRAWLEKITKEKGT